MAIAVHGVPYLTDRGLSLEMAGTVVATYTAISLAFQLLSGFVGDRVDKRFGIAAFVAVQGLGIILLAFVGSLPMVFLFAVLFGIGLGGRTPLLNAIRGDYFGRRSFGTILGLSTLPMNLGMMVTPLLLGILYDLQRTYVYGFLGLGIATAAAGALMLFAPPPGVAAAAPTEARLTRRT
jgi:MFS family permease